MRLLNILLCIPFLYPSVGFSMHPIIAEYNARTSWPYKIATGCCVGWILTTGMEFWGNSSFTTQLMRFPARLKEREGFGSYTCNITIDGNNKVITALQAKRDSLRSRLNKIVLPDESMARIHESYEQQLKHPDKKTKTE